MKRMEDVDGGWQLENEALLRRLISYPLKTI